eukprot:TCONS_00014677-protein
MVSKAGIIAIIFSGLAFIFGFTSIVDNDWLHSKSTINGVLISEFTASMWESCIRFSGQPTECSANNLPWDWLKAAQGFLVIGTIFSFASLLATMIVVFKQKMKPIIPPIMQ